MASGSVYCTLITSRFFFFFCYYFANVPSALPHRAPAGTKASPTEGERTPPSRVSDNLLNELHEESLPVAFPFIRSAVSTCAF